jgi:hypothetical protein
VRRRWDPEGKLRSAQSVRLLGDARVKVAFLGATKGIGRALARLMAERGRRAVPAGPRHRRPGEERPATWRCAPGRAGSGRRLATWRGRRRSRRRSRRPRRPWAAWTPWWSPPASSPPRTASRRTWSWPGAWSPRTSRTPWSSASTRASGCWPGAAGRSACSAPWPESGAASRWRSTVRPRPASRATWRPSTTSSAARGCGTVCVKPGFVKTSMTDGLPAPPFAGEPEAVARRVLRAIDRGQPVVYAPAIWRWIMLVNPPAPALRHAEDRVLGFTLSALCRTCSGASTLGKTGTVEWRPARAGIEVIDEARAPPSSAAATRPACPSAPRLAVRHAAGSAPAAESRSSERPATILPNFRCST